MCKVVEFKLIEGYDDYMVSSDGKVWSLKYGKTKELKPRSDKDGYLRVCLCTNGQIAQKLVHRLVAEAFITNPDNKPQVNHEDEDKTNNCVDNLEWCNAEYNTNYGTRNERITKGLVGNNNASKAVVCLETGVVYPSAHEASRQTCINRPNISACCNGKRKTAGGYHWAKVE